MGNGIIELDKNWADGEFWTEEIMDEVKDQVDAANLQHKYNLDQLVADILPPGYTLDDDGNGNLTNKIYNKQVNSSSYSTSVNAGTSTDADFTNADGTNLILQFTPEIAGRYLVTMSFSVEVVPTGGNAVVYDALWRMIDSATPTPNPSKGVYLAFDPKTVDARMIVPVTLSHVFTFAASAQTIKLQKKILTATNLGTHQVKSSANLYEFAANAIKL